MAMRIASFTVSAILPFSSRNDALVIGANSAWWSIHIWMRRPSWSVLRLQVMAMSGERSSQALPTPVVRLVAPGPSVAMQRPGFPVMRPVTSAAKPAEPSCAVSTKSTPPFRIASISGSTLPLGMPKPRSMPAAFRVATMRSALFMERHLGALVPCICHTVCSASCPACAGHQACPDADGWDSPATTLGWAAQPPCGQRTQVKMSATMPAYHPMFSACVCLRSSAVSPVLETKVSVAAILPSFAA